MLELKGQRLEEFKAVVRKWADDYPEDLKDEASIGFLSMGRMTPAQVADHVEQETEVGRQFIGMVEHGVNAGGMDFDQVKNMFTHKPTDETMLRYVFYRSANATTPFADVKDAIEADNDLIIVDQTGDKAMLVQGKEANLQKIKSQAEGWAVSPETHGYRPSV